MELPSSIKSMTNGLIAGATLAIIGFATGIPLLGWLGVILFLLFARLYQALKTEGHFKNAFNGCIWPTIFLILSLTWLMSLISALGGLMGDLVSLNSPVTIGVIMILVILFHVVSEKIYTRRIWAFMSRQTVEEEHHAPPEVFSEVAEKTSLPSELAFQIYDLNSRILVEEDTSARNIYDQALNRSGRMLFYGMLLALIINLAVSVGVISYENYLDGAPLVAGLLFSILHLFPFLLSLAVGILVYHRHAGIHWLLVIATGFFVNLWNFLILISESQKDPATHHTIVEIPLIGSIYWLPLIAYFSIIAPCLIIYMVKQNAIPGSRFINRDKGIRLLILRVFGVDKNTFSLFSSLGRYWQHAGPVLTIVDPSYSRFELGEDRFRFILTAMTPLLFLLALSAADWNFISAFIPWMPAMFLFFYVPLWIAYLFRRFNNISHQFARNTEALKLRIEFESTADSVLSNRFQQGTLYCYDNLWRTALRELVAGTDLILMDLRNFSSTNKGCEYEINFLLNHFSLQRAVFLIDASTDLPLFQDFVQAQWQQLDANSPNHSTLRQSINIYRSAGNIKKDTQKIITILSMVTVTNRTENPIINKPSIVENASVPAKQSPVRLHLGLLLGWCLVVVGLTLQLIWNQDGMYITSGISIAWLGTILIMLFSRLKMLLQRDGHFRNIFLGFPWPQIFWLIAGAWIFLYLIIRLS